MNTIQLSKNDLAKIIPKRSIDSHKGNCGKLLHLCGSLGFTGAAALAAMAAMRTGAGLVFLGVPEAIYAIEAVKLNEPIVFPLPDVNGMLSSNACPAIEKRLVDMDAVLIGPGLGQSSGTEEAVITVLESYPGPVILDADGINVICSHKDILRGRTFPTVLTPHEGEFARLLGRKVTDRMTDAVQFAREHGVVLLLKGHNTLITDGDICYVNPTGNPGMAVGGCGDVLAGIISALLGFGISPLLAAACGAWLHGAAGDISAQTYGNGLIPTDMLESLPRLLKQVVVD